MGGGSCEQFGIEMGSRASSLKDIQWGIISGVGNTAQDLESELTENEERSNKQEQVPTQCLLN